jgi:hypothetical protein
MSNATNQIETVSSIITSELALDWIVATALKRNMGVSVRDIWTTGQEICILSNSRDFAEIRDAMGRSGRIELRFWDIPEVGNSYQIQGYIELTFSRSNTGLESVGYYRGERIERLVSDVEARIQKFDDLYKSLGAI